MRLNLQVKIWLALITLYLAWGSTYLAIHFMVLKIPPVLASGLRNLVAGVMILIFTLVVGSISKITKKDFLKLAIPGILMLSLGNGLLTIAAKWVPSGYMSLFPALVPAWIVILQWFFGEKPNRTVIFGLIIGFVGLFLLVNKSALAISGFEQYFGLGVFLLLAATIAWSCGVVLSVRNPLPFSVAFISAMQMIIGGSCSIILGGFIGEFAQFSFQNINQAAFIAFIWLVLVGSILGFSVFVWVSGKTSPTMVSTYSYVNPLVALYLGWLVLGEQLNGNILIATALIVVSVVLVTWGGKKIK